MIDEDALAGMLAAYAERIPVPAAAIDAVLEASPRHESPRRFTRASARVLAAAATVVVIAGAAFVVNHHSATRATADASRGIAAKSPSTIAGARNAPPGLGAGTTGGGAAADTTHDPARAGIPSLQAQQGGYRQLATNDAAATLGSTKPTGTGGTATTDSARVVRTGTLDLRIARTTFGSVIGRITTITAAAGGYVSDAKTFESATTPSGTVTIRVPSGRFNATVQRLRALGTVVSASTRGVDVTGQYTDLQARLHAATATRDQYLTVLAQATNINDILAVQDRIQGVQTTIEQLQGQINELTNQSAFGTIAISVTEPAPKAKPVIHHTARSGVAIAWDNARNGFSRRIEGIISHSGSVLVVVIGLLLIAGALRLLFPRMRRLLV